MDSNRERLIKCKRCGSYNPGEWSRCGRCGRPVHAKSSVGSAVKLLFLVLVIITAYHYKDKLLAFIGSVEESVNIISLNNENSSDRDISPSSGAAVLESKTAETPEVSLEKAEVKQTSESTPAPTAASSSKPNSTAKAETSEPAATPKTAAKTDYDLIYDALITGSDSVRLSSKNTSDQVFGMIEEIVLNQPLIQFYEGCTYRSDGLLTLKYNKPKDFIKKADTEVKQKAKEIISSIIKPNMTDFQKELAIHDYIVNHSRYDIESYNAGTIPPESHSVYGILINNKAVCEGYAKAMKLLLDLAGVESRVVTGDSKGQSHAWNLVKIDGAWYHVDSTWDDPVMADGGQTLQYTYFNLSDREIGADHHWDTGSYPKCSSTAYNYFTYFKKQVSSPDEFLSYVVKSAENGENHVTVRITDYSAEKYDMKDLIRTAVTLVNADASYSVNEDYGVVEVWFGSK